MSHEKKDSALQKMQLILLSAAIMIVLAQLNINLIINGFKISLAVICLPLFAFLFEHFPVFPVTLITAPGILLVRCIVEWLHSGEIAEAFWSYSPEMFFHLMYGGLFAIYVQFFPIRHFRLEQFLPILGIDVISNLTEIFVRLGTDALTTAVLLRLVIVGIGRTVLAVVLLASFDAYGLSILRKDDRIRYRKLLLLTSQLKSEVIWMNKNTSRIEETMAVSYSLFNELNAKEGMGEIAQKALTVAKDIHEVKKEYYLIMNGISDALNTDQEESGMWMKNIFGIMQESVRHVFGDYGQNMRLDVVLEKNFYTDKHYYLMSVLRNLINNAAEAAGNRHARVVLSGKEDGEDYVIGVHDDCGGIDEEYLPTIFMPGFSTKINYETGQVSRGLGLSLVKDIVESELGGSISVTSEDGCTDFTIRIPKENLEVEA
ncbi:sensor histidine kinase [Negativibacillus massiliensis]|uniref:sensor histidine kinase n=1 Tax=Negativibacillus massiliensis TaxID=1871035 RepID=UPI003AF25709